MTWSHRVRPLLGVLLKDLPRYVSTLGPGGPGYLAVCNRGEVVEPAPDGSGYRCNWQWTSDLHAPRLLPGLGRRLMEASLKDHPVCFRENPIENGSSPDVSFVIGHRGDHKLPHLLKTLECIAGQQGVAVECVVVEQDTQPRVRNRLPGWVHHLHAPPPASGMSFCRSWAFNVGARYARGELLVLHDNDILVPADYAALCVQRVRAGFDVVNLKRFGFYLDEAHTRDLLARCADVADRRPEAIVQNALGGSLAVSRAAYLSIGGMDEGFVGWGGEDNEFWERAQTLRVWPYGCLPYVHLWHPSQPGKYDGANPTLARYRTLSSLPVRDRIERLRVIPSGAMSGPVDWHARQAAADTSVVNA